MKCHTMLWIALCFIEVLVVKAQKHDYIWLAGRYPVFPTFYLDFHQYPPVSRLQKLDIDTDGINLSISDSSGVPLFFSNGCVIRNARNEVMPGGEEINSGSWHDEWCHSNSVGFYYYMERSIFALPAPNNRYYIFHLRLEDDKATKTLLMSLVDVQANGGRGQVVFRDRALVSGLLQVASANRHANGRDWWILVAHNDRSLFHRFLLTPEGLQGPWEQKIENPTAKNAYYYGWSQFSPDGRTYAIHHTIHGMSVYRFNRCDGMLSDLRYLPRYETRNVWNYGLAISPDSRFLYREVGGAKRIVQYDLQAPELALSEVLIADTMAPVYSFNYMHTGPDGRIYVWFGGRDDINTINHPNRKGKACGFQFQSVKLPAPSNNGAHYYYPNYRLGPIDGSSCDTLGIDNLPEALWRHDVEDALQPLRVTFTDLSYYEPTEWHWTFGDGAVSRDTSPVHTYARAGTYRVCLVVKNQNVSDTLCRDITVGVSDAQEALAVGPQMQVLPNPFDASLQVLLSAEAEGARLHFSLCDALGRPVREARLSGSETEIATAGLAAGLYFWVVQRNGRVWQRGRVAKF